MGYRGGIEVIFFVARERRRWGRWRRWRREDGREVETAWLI